MDDAMSGCETFTLETPPKEKEDLAILQAIIKDTSRNVSTQTVDVSTDSIAVQSFSPGNESHLQVDKGNLHRQSCKNRKSSFKLFIVPDDPETNVFHDSGLSLSFEEEQHGNNAQSLQFSVVSNEEEGKNRNSYHRRSAQPLHFSVRSNELKKENKISEPLRNYETIKKAKRPRNTYKQSEYFIQGKDKTSSIDFENVTCGLTTDHQLKQSENPSVLAWLKLKNFEEREKKKAKNREKKELRRLAYEEAEEKQRRIEESERRFEHWLAAKRKEARRVWKKTRRRKRVGTTEDEVVVHKDSDPPPNYTVVPTFKRDQALAGEKSSLDIGKANANTFNLNGTETKVEVKDNIIKSNPFLEAQLNSDIQELNINGNTLSNEIGKSEIRNNRRPATVESRSLSVCGKNSKIWQEKDSNRKRPSTSAGRLTSNCDNIFNKEIKGMSHEAWVAQKRKEKNAKRLNSVSVNSEEGKTMFKKSITFEAWNAQKRKEDKEKATQKKREVVDEALTEAIMNVVRKRVENSEKGKRELDTGMPKWRARNRVKSCSAEDETQILKSPSKYTVIQMLKNEVNELGTQASESWEQVNESTG